MNRRCLPEPPGVAMGSTLMLCGGTLGSSSVNLCCACGPGSASVGCSGTAVVRSEGTSILRCAGISSTCCLGTPVACCVGTTLAHCSGTSSPLFDCTSALVLGGGVTGISSSSDHSNTTVLCIRVVWSPPSEMPPSLRGAAATVFLFFRAGSSSAALFP